MKKQLLATLGVGTIGIASYAATFMQVVTNDGSIVEYDVENVSEVNFVKKDVVVPQDTTPSSNHSYVDLGLPSGTLWATYNIGATKPEEYGDYFAWGETEPKDVYDWSTYKWGDDEMTKYNDGDGLMTLLPEDDAATANWGSEWRMPTNEEQRELVEECQYQNMYVNGVYVAKFTGKNGNSVFFPAAGNRYGSGVDNKRFGYYWSSSLGEELEDYARGLEFHGNEAYWSSYGDRYDGLPVRAVRVQKAERKMYVVKFYTSDSVLINSQEVLEGASAKEIQAPEKNGYEFIGWSASLDKITSNMSVYALYKEKSPIDTPSSNHSYVDLGLPSGTLWATYNIGATKPEEYGDYFAWGETEPKEVYDWSTYKWEDDEMTKYNDGDGLMTLLPEDDAATANWGSEWRMPTNEEQRELVEECQYKWTKVNGVNGAKFTGKNGNSVFFPATGFRYGSDASIVGNNGYYWSSSLGEELEDSAGGLSFYELGAYLLNDFRFNGFSVRAVVAKK